jgi:low affinity Fe/Cu permease
MKHQVSHPFAPPTTEWFDSFARKASLFCGKPIVFLGAVSIVVIWAATGPLFGYSDTWQLVINTGTTIITFLMVFLIQNTQNRDSKAMQLKLDELIRATQGAHNALLDLEELTESDLNRVRKLYMALATHARSDLARGLLDTDIPDVVLAESADRTGR